MSTVKKVKPSPAQLLAEQDAKDAENGIGKRLGLRFMYRATVNSFFEDRREKKAKRTHKPIYSVPALEMLASKLSTGGDGEFVYYDNSPAPTTVQSAVYAIWLGSIAAPFGWMVFWAKYLNHNKSRAHFLAWAESEITRSGAKPEHTKELTEMLGKTYFEGRSISGRRIAKKLKIEREFTVPRYVDTINHILDAAYASENELGRQVSKMGR